MFLLNHATSATATAGCGGSAATANGLIRILPEIPQDEVFLIGFGQFAFNAGGVLALQQRTGGFTFRMDGVLDVAVAKSDVVIQLPELLTDVVVHSGDALLGVAAAVGDLHLQIPLSELVLIRRISDIGVGGAELIAKVHIQVADTVADAVDILCDEVQTGFIPGGCRSVADRNIRTQGADAAATATRRTSAAATAEAITSTTAPAEQKQNDDPCEPSTATVTKPAVAIAVHQRHGFPTGKTRTRTGVHIVNRDCIHFRFLSVKG